MLLIRNKSLLIFLIVNYFSIITCSIVEIGIEEDNLHRYKRQLLFPNTTILQLNAGLGTPTPIKTINVNWAFQANFQLPWNRTQVPLDILDANSGYVGTARRRREIEEDYTSDAKLYHFYKFVEEIVSGFGHNGTSCVLQTFCQLGAEPLHSENKEDLLHEIATFVLNPLNDIKEQGNEESLPYIQAYEAGRRNGDCFDLYNDCSLSLIDLFSTSH